MINVGYIISWLQLPQGTERNSFILVIGLFDLVFVIALKDLVIGITDHFQVFVDKTFVDIEGYGGEGDLCLKVFKYGIQAFELAGILRKEVERIFFSFPGFE